MTTVSIKHPLTTDGHLSEAPAEAGAAPSTHRSSARGSAHRALIRLAVAASLLALVWVSLTSHSNFWEFVTATDQIYHAHRVLRAAQHLVNLEQEAEIGVRGFHITGQDRYLAPYRRAQRDMPAALDTLGNLTAQDAAQRGRFETLKPLLNTRMEMREREIAARRAGGIDLAEIALLTKEDRYKVDRVRLLLTEIQRAAEKTLTEGHAAALHNEQRSLYLFIIANLLVLAVIAYLLVSREKAIREREAEARRESEQRFGQMAAMTGEWLWEQDAEGRFIYSNSTVKEILGYAPEELLGRPYFDFFTPRDRDRVLQSAYDADLHSRFVRLLNHYQHRDGHQVITESTGVPLRDAHGNIVKWRGVDRDITVHKWFENALRESEAPARSPTQNRAEGRERGALSAE
jgi:PAS domain S-box-containing protein